MGVAAVEPSLTGQLEALLGTAAAAARYDISVRGGGISYTAGERWVPVHGLLPHSRAATFLEALDGLYAEQAEAMRRLKVTSGYLLAEVGPSALLIEPVFYWPDARLPIHERSVEPAHLARLRVHPANPEARGYVHKLRGTVIELFARFGAVHFQVGRTYPYRATRTASAGVLVDRMKQALDPAHRLAPGALGLAPTGES